MSVLNSWFGRFGRTIRFRNCVRASILQYFWFIEFNTFLQFKRGQEKCFQGKTKGDRSNTVRHGYGLDGARRLLWSEAKPLWSLRIIPLSLLILVPFSEQALRHFWLVRRSEHILPNLRISALYPAERYFPTAFASQGSTGTFLLLSRSGR